MKEFIPALKKNFYFFGLIFIKKTEKLCCI